MNIAILVDSDSWIVPYAKRLRDILSEKHKVRFCYVMKRIGSGDLAFFLSCSRIIPDSILRLHKHNLVVHESNLPKGKGMSPLTWQILEGKDRIPIVLFEAASKVDGGSVFLRDVIGYKGTELVDELRKKQGEKTIELILRFLKVYPGIVAKEQSGRSNYYRRRTPEDSELDINKTLKQQFNKLRVVDNKRYPAFFKYKGAKYIIKVYKAGRDSDSHC